MVAKEKWQKVSWRRGTKGRLECLFAARRVRVADGHRHRMLDNRVQAMPGEEVWLVGARRSTGEQKYYVLNLPADATLKMLAAAIKARWICEQAHQQLKEELGLDHFEGRSWVGLHRHALMTMIAYAFLQSRRLKAAGTVWAAERVDVREISWLDQRTVAREREARERQRRHFRFTAIKACLVRIAHDRQRRRDRWRQKLSDLSTDR